MAFDPKDLRPVNISRINSDESRISISNSGTARNQDGFYTNPPRTDAGSPPAPPLYYAVAAGDAGLGFSNPTLHPLQVQPPIPMWGPRLSPPVVQPGVSPPPLVITSPGQSTSPNLGPTRPPGSNGSAEQASDDGGDDSLSRRKIKFLCSFGGKILPRPSDGTLRYVGGQTRIISVTKDVSFNELVQKMMTACGQPVSIKYQLPDEDLDALVSVSCPDDLENMMEEYDKLMERSSDGSSKLRVFLFSSSDLEPSGMAHLDDLQDSGQKYVDAVNGVREVGGPPIMRKESITSLTSTQNSDLRGTEVVDGFVTTQEVSGPPSTSILSPGSDSTSTINNENLIGSSGVDVKPAVPLSEIESSSVPLVVPVGPGPPSIVSSLLETTPERTAPLPSLQQPLMGVYDLPLQSSWKFPPPPSPYLQGFVDPHQDALNSTTSQMIYGNHPMVVSPRPIMIQHPYHESIPGIPQHVIPTVHMTMASPSNHLSMNPNIIPQIMQSQRVVAVPAEQSYSAFQAQVPTGGVPGFGWHQVLSQQNVPFSESRVPHHQEQVMMPENISKLEDCGMCQRQLPHAHSDTVVQEQSNSNGPSPTLSDVSSLYRSLCLKDFPRIHPINQVAVTTQPEVAGLSQNSLEPQPEIDKIASKGINETNVMVVPQGVMGIAGGTQGPHGVVMGKPSQSLQEEPVQNIFPQMSQVRKPAADENAIVTGVPVIATQPMSHEEAKDYSGHVIVSREDTSGSNISGEFIRPSEGMMEQFQVIKPESLSSCEQNKSSHTDYPRKDDVFDQKSRQMLPNAAYSNPSLVPEVNSIQTVASHSDQDSVIANNNIQSSVSPSKWTGNIQESSNSLYSNQDPFYFRHDSPFPPPKPSKIATRREVSGGRDVQPENQPSNNGEQNLQGHLVDPSSIPSGDLGKDYGSDQTVSSREDIIKQDLQATAEGVAASVLQGGSSAMNSNASIAGASDVNHQRGTETNSDAIIQSKLEGMNVKSEETNLGFPLSGDLGRLQIIKNSDLEELRELGSGTFGTVYHGKWRGTDVAIKRINDRCFAGKPSEQERMRSDFWNEAIKLADLHHPNVVAFYGVVLDGPGGSVATVTEYMVNGSLRTALQKSERTIDKRKRLLIAMDVAFGMEYLHSRNIVHFDLKSDNLLVNLRDPHRPICKVGDLGLSKVKCQTLISGGVRGTLPWMAPELLNGSSSLVSEKVDVFSYGIVMWELITGQEPYADLHYGAIIGGIVSNTLRPPVPETCDVDWKSLMERCWLAEPSERPNFTEIVNELRSMAAKLPPKSHNQVSNQRTTNA